jgi:hypothetical protein
MWMRVCAIFKTVLFKSRLAEKVRCQCGWEWRGQRPRVGTLSDSKSYTARHLVDSDSPAQNLNSS